MRPSEKKHFWGGENPPDPTPLPHLVSRGLACMQYANINNIQTFWCIIRFRSVGSTIINVYRKSIIDLYSWLWKCGLNDEMNENSDYTTFYCFCKAVVLYTICTWVHPGISGGGIRVAHHFSFLCCVVVCFVLFCLSSSCVLCTQCWQFIWIVHWFLIIPSVFSYVYLTIFGLKLRWNTHNNR